jgi:hypothetical protein
MKKDNMENITFHKGDSISFGYNNPKLFLLFNVSDNLTEWSLVSMYSNILMREDGGHFAIDSNSLKKSYRTSNLLIEKNYTTKLLNNTLSNIFNN